MCVVRVSHGLLQTTVGIGTVSIWDFDVAHTRGGGLLKGEGATKWRDSPSASLKCHPPANHRANLLFTDQHQKETPKSPSSNGRGPPPRAARTSAVVTRKKKGVGAGKGPAFRVHALCVPVVCPRCTVLTGRHAPPTRPLPPQHARSTGWGPVPRTDWGAATSPPPPPPPLTSSTQCRDAPPPPMGQAGRRSRSDDPPPPLWGGGLAPQGMW